MAFKGNRKRGVLIFEDYFVVEMGERWEEEEEEAKEKIQRFLNKTLTLP